MTTLQDLLDQLQALPPEQRRLPATYLTEPGHGMGRCLRVGEVPAGTVLGPGFAFTKPLPTIVIETDPAGP